MKISVKSKGARKITILFPSCLIFNSLTSTCAAGIINKKLKENDAVKCKIPAKQLRRLSRAIMKYKKNHRGWNLVEVKSSDGDNVVVRL